MHFELSGESGADLLLREPAMRVAAAMLRLDGCHLGASSGSLPIEVDATQKELAVIANATRTNAGSILGEPAQTGFVEIGYGKIMFLRPEGLRTSIRAWRTYQLLFFRSTNLGLTGKPDADLQNFPEAPVADIETSSRTGHSS